MCHRLCNFIWGIWWFLRSKEFEAIKVEKSAIQPWMSCKYNKNMVVDLLSFVVDAPKYSVLNGKVVLEGCVSWPLGCHSNNPGVSSRNLLERLHLMEWIWNPNQLSYLSKYLLRREILIQKTKTWFYELWKVVINKYILPVFEDAAINNKCIHNDFIFCSIFFLVFTFCYCCLRFHYIICKHHTLFSDFT